MEDQAALGRVVVGDEDDRLRPVRVAGLRDDVVRGAARQRAPEQVRAGGHVVGDQGGRGEPREGAGRPGAAGEARGRPHGAQERDGNRERPGRGLRLDPRGRAQRLELVSQPLGGAPLARRRGRALDRLQVLDEGAQAVRVRRHGRAG